MSMNGGSGLEPDPSDHGPLGDPAEGTEGLAAPGLEDDPLNAEDDDRIERENDAL